MCLNWCDATPVWATSALRLVEAKVEKKSAYFKPNLIFTHSTIAPTQAPRYLWAWKELSLQRSEGGKERI